MATGKSKTRSKSSAAPPAMSAARRARAAMSRESRAAYAEIEQGVKHLGKSIEEIQRGFRRAERKVEADARRRVRELRKDARVQLSVLKVKQREVAGALKNVSGAAGESWREIQRSADTLLADARTTAAAVVERFRNALKS